MIEPVGARFSVKFHALKDEATLVQARKTEPRLVGTADSALKLPHKLGVRRIVLDWLEHWHPKQADLGRRSHTQHLDQWMNGRHVGVWSRHAGRDMLRYSAASAAAALSKPCSDSK